MLATRSEQLKRTQHREDFDFGTPSKSKNHDGSTFNKLGHVSQDSKNINRENKLPINLFYTAAEYNKMLITNGRSIKKKSQPIIEGFISNLQFINDPIFQSCQQRRETLKFKQKQTGQSSSRKPANSFTQECLCCCCDEYCQVCVKQQEKTHYYKQDRGEKLNSYKLSQLELEQGLQKVNSKPLKAKKNRKKIITSEVKIKAPKEVQNSEKQCSSSYLSHKSFNIKKLVYKSLIHFQEQKREEKLKKLFEKQQKMHYDVLMSKFEQQVRLRNRQSVSRSKSKLGSNKKLKPLSKNTIRLKYWKSIRDQIVKSLQKDKIQGSVSKSLEKLSKSTINCSYKVKITPQQMVILALKHEKQAKAKLAKEAREKSQKKKQIQRRLQQVQRQRIQHLKSCQKRKFKPTQQMIDQAFKNIIQQKKPQPIPKKAHSKNKARA